MSFRAITPFPVFILIALCGASSGRADVRRGEQFAATWCSVCHAVKPGQSSADLKAPGFPALADNPSTNEASLRASLGTTPHWTMPKFKLRSGDLQDVTDYILSLKSKPQNH
jgi:mono/diheme cytochrome c family protein